MKNFPKGSTLETTGLLVLGLVAGSMAGRGIMAVVPNKTGLTESEQKKQDMIKMAAQVGVAGLGYLGSAYAKEQKSNPFVEGLGYGVAAVNVLDMVTDLSGKSSAVQSQVNSGTKTGKILGTALGLKCPCDNVQVMPAVMLNGARKRSRLRGPGFDVDMYRFNAQPVADYQLS